MRTNSHRPLLHVGSTGSQVKKVEERLVSQGYLKHADDRFDAGTARAVVAYKKDHGWKGKPQGVVGDRMLAKLGVGGAHQSSPTQDPGGKGQTPSQLKGATYNVERDRSPAQVGQWLGNYAKSNDLDFVQVQEINGYHQALNQIPGYHLITFPSAKDHGESGVLVKDSLLAKNAKLIQGEGGGWTTVRGGHAPPRAAVAVQLAGWLEVASVHQPPSVDFKNGHAVGPKNRISTYESLSQKLLGFGKQQLKNNPDLALLIGGDWNESGTSTAKYSPGWLAKQLGMKVYDSAASHGRGHIDYVMANGCRVSNVKAGPTGGSDHNIVTYTVTQPKGKR